MDFGDLSDEKIASELQGGNRLAMEALLARHSRRLFGWLRRHVQREHDAEDIFQNFCLNVFMKISTFRPEKGCLFNWLLAVMGSCLSNYYRRPKLPISDVLATAEQKLDTDADPLLNLLRSEDWERLHRALAELPVEKRNVLILWFFGGLKAREIAEKLKIPENTVHSRKLAGLRKLRTLLNGGNS
jgi:RNA polymerase sigma factor (sigma-70 family)